MTRKISVRFVGSSAQRQSAHHILAAHGFDVFRESTTGNGEVAPSPQHDAPLLHTDTAASDGRELVIINGEYEDNIYQLQARVKDWTCFPDGVMRMLRSVEAMPAGDGDQECSADELRELVAGLPGVVFRCGIDSKGSVDFMNERIAEVCGYTRGKFMRRSSRRLLSLVPRVERRQLAAIIQESASSGKPFSHEHRILCAGGEERWLWHRGCVYRDRREHAELESFVVDITDRKTEEQQLAWLASHDALTGVANRSMFMEQIGKSIQRADRHNEMVACLFLDLDRFKNVNDSYGHAFGDELLQQIAARLKRCVRGNDLIGRLGGDEFAVLLDGIDQPQDAVAAARKILEELDKPYTIGQRTFSSSASIGISCYPGDAHDRASLLRNADAAMYSVKSSGRDGYLFYSTDMSSKAFETLAISNALRDAVDTEAVALCYQPRIDLRSGRIKGLEIFARWKDDEFGEISPSRFIGLAEDTGLMEPLGDLILRKTLQQAQEWEKQGLDRMRLSLNLSSQQFRSESLVERIKSELARTRIHPERLELEIFEATLMQDAVAAIDTLAALRELGVTLSVSRFGSGYSSLQLLQNFKLDFLKMDRSVMQGVPRDKDQLAVAEAIIIMARRLGLRVVAEGIETQAQGDFARTAGCDEGQGYLYGHPVPADEVSGYLERHVH